MRHAQRKSLILLASVIVTMLMLPAMAHAAPRVELYDVQTLLNSDGTREMLVAAEVAEDAKLPVTLRLPVPKGAKVDWAGEILGGDPSQDPKAKYTIETGADVDTVVLTLERATRGQVELRLAGSTGGVLGLDWSAPTPAAGAQLVVQVPAGSTVTSYSAGAVPEGGGAAGSVFVKRFDGVKAGQKLQLSIGYKRTANSAQQSSGQGAQGGQVQNNARPVTGGAPYSPVVALMVLAVILVGTFYALGKVRPQHDGSDGGHR